MKKVYILEDSTEVANAINEIMNRCLAYAIEIIPILYFASELTIECDPSDIAEIEEILAPLV